MRGISRSASRVRPLALCLLLAACAPTAVGAAGGIGYTSRGATALVHAQVPEVFESTAAVFEEMGIELTDRQGRTGRGGSAVGNDITVNGRRGDAEVVVAIERETGASSEVFVRVREGRADYNRELAGEILARIVAKR